MRFITTLIEMICCDTDLVVSHCIRGSAEC